MTGVKGKLVVRDHCVIVCTRSFIREPNAMQVGALNVWFGRFNTTDVDSCQRDVLEIRGDYVPILSAARY